MRFEFEFDIEAEPYRLLFNEEKLRQRSGFRVVVIDFPLDQLSIRWHDARFGWINMSESNDLVQTDVSFISQRSGYRSVSKSITVQLSRDPTYNFEGSTGV
jgi:hypothetical protein